jgi:amino acid permease
MSKISIVRETQTLRKVENEDKLVDDLGNLAAINDGNLAYKDMKSIYYYAFTLVYYVIILAGAIFIPKIDTVIEFVGVICVNCMSFIFPSMFYLSASKNYQKNRANLVKNFSPDFEGLVQKRNMTLEVISYATLGMGAVYFVIGFYNNIYGIVNNES